MRRLLTIALVSLMSTICFAHRDTVLKLNPDGRLDGLPAEYSPATLRIAFSQSSEPGAPPISRLELKIGAKSVVVPQCVTALIITRNIKDVRVVASWYHTNSGLPPYLDVTLFDPGHKGGDFRPGYKLLFDLSKVRLFRMDVMILRDGNSVQYVPVDISERCASLSDERRREFL